MDTTPDIVIRNGYLHDRDEVVDIAVASGRIHAIDGELGAEAAIELDASGNLVSPGLVDAHVHLDMSRSAYGGRRPRNNDEPTDVHGMLRKTADYFADTSMEVIESNARQTAMQAVKNGVLHLRTHAYVDGAVGADVVDAVSSAVTPLEDCLDVEIVAFPQQGILRDDGSIPAVREALRTGADLVGGLDPASVNGDRTQTMATWFDMAAEFNADIDVHIHEREEMGLESLEALARTSMEREFDGRVTASHAFALADLAETDLGSKPEPETGDQRSAVAIERFETADLGFVTCYQSTPQTMPIERIHDTGLVLAHGTDQAHDIWGVHGNIDPLEAMLVESIKLPAYDTNGGLSHLWDLITGQGGRLLGLDEYAIEIGTPADIVVHASKSPYWAIVENRTPRAVVKDGCLVARNGRFLDDRDCMT